MPPAPPSEESSAFTVINHEEKGANETKVNVVDAELAPPLPSNVNVVKPLQLDDESNVMPVAPAPNTILDPKFSRALDFKLRRLKEKEILQANLRRPTRYRPRNGILAASNPNVSTGQLPLSDKPLSQSHPRINHIESENEKKISPNMDKSPELKSRSRNAPSSMDGDKPRFVTTVKCGQFLLPPPEVARILGLETLYPTKEREKVMYSYSSKPKVVAPRAKRCVLEKKAEAKLPNGDVVEGVRRPHAGEVFGGVRALIAGVVGMTHMLEKHDQPYVTHNTSTFNYNILYSCFSNIGNN